MTDEQSELARRLIATLKYELEQVFGSEAIVNMTPEQRIAAAKSALEATIWRLPYLNS